MGTTILVLWLFINMMWEPFWRTGAKPAFFKTFTILFALIGGILGKRFHFLDADDLLFQEFLAFFSG